MANPFKSQTSANFGLLLARVPMGLFFFLAGFNKIKGGVKDFVDGSAQFIPHYLPDVIGRAYLYLLPWTELLVGCLIVLGFFSRLAGMISSLIIISAILAVTGLGDKALPFSTNVIMLGVTLLLLFTGPGAIALDNIRFRGSSIKSKKAE